MKNNIGNDDLDELIKSKLDSDLIDEFIIDCLNNKTMISDLNENESEKTLDLIKKAILHNDYFNRVMDNHSLYLDDFDKRLQESIEFDKKIDELEKLGDEKAINQAIDEYLIKKQMREYDQFGDTFNIAIDKQINNLQSQNLIDEDEAIDKYVGMVEQERLRKESYDLNDDQKDIIDYLNNEKWFRDKIEYKINKIIEKMR